MKYKVYHTRNWALNSKLHFIDSVELCPEFQNGYKPFKSNYKLVAVVETDALGNTFGLTNHIDVEWWKNDGVELIEESRSTSVGDLVEDIDGNLWMCASCGWTEVKWADDKDDPYEIVSDEYGEYKIQK